jgi:hypothetical protein
MWTGGILLFLSLLVRALICREPVADRSSPAWRQLLATKRQAREAYEAENYNEAQRLLYDCLQVRMAKASLGFN